MRVQVVWRPCSSLLPALYNTRMPEDQPAPRRTSDHLRARLLTFAFQQLYGPFAWAYDWVSRTFFLGQWRAWQRATIPHLLGPDVLEIGMGTGDLQFDLLRAGFIARGIDLSPQMMREARGPNQSSQAGRPPQHQRRPRPGPPLRLVQLQLGRQHLPQRLHRGRAHIERDRARAAPRWPSRYHPRWLAPAT